MAAGQPYKNASAAGRRTKTTKSTILSTHSLDDRSLIKSKTSTPKNDGLQANPKSNIFLEQKKLNDHLTKFLIGLRTMVNLNEHLTKFLISPVNSLHDGANTTNFCFLMVPANLWEAVSLIFIPGGPTGTYGGRTGPVDIQRTVRRNGRTVPKIERFVSSSISKLVSVKSTLPQ